MIQSWTGMCLIVVFVWQVSSAMYGLRRMDSSFQEVQDVVAVLARKIEASPDVFNSQVISNCLYGLQSMSCQHEAVRYLVSVLRHKIELSDIRGGECMNAQGVGNALYGLRYQGVRLGLIMIHPSISL